jgi:poly-beta-1,6-N-acetyl-D-glucosamine N-deacetylase
MPILYLHRVVSIPADISSWASGSQEAFMRHSIPACAFAAQLDWLRTHAYQTVLPRDVIAFWDQGRALPANPIILTFDDGSPDWYSTIFPILLAHGFTAEFYVSLDNIGSSISWDQLREMAAAGMGIGAHDVNHFQLTGGSVVPASPEVMRFQVTEAKRVLETQLGIPVDSMAYVGGGYDATLMGIVQAAGYSSARAINRGVWQEPGARYRLRISRVGFWDDVVGGTLENAINCVLDPALPTFESRVAGANPG